MTRKKFRKLVRGTSAIIFKARGEGVDEKVLNGYLDIICSLARKNKFKVTYEKEYKNYLGRFLKEWAKLPNIDSDIEKYRIPKNILNSKYGIINSK